MNNFELGQKVLVRNYDGDTWEPAFYGYEFKTGSDDDYEIYHHIMDGRSRSGFLQCIPLEGNEALIGRTGNSLECLDHIEPEHQKFKFLEKVEINLSGGDDGWKPAIYINYSNLTCNKSSPHQVVMIELNDGIHDNMWVSDEEIRPIK